MSIVSVLFAYVLAIGLSVSAWSSSETRGPHPAADTPPVSAPATDHPAEDTFRRAVSMMASATTPEEQKAAVEQFSIAAQAGHPEAQFKLGDAYEHAIGVPANASKALEWYVSAATNRHEGAIRKLKAGIVYPGESERSVSIAKGKQTEKFWEIKTGTARLRDGRLCRRAEFTGTLKTYEEGSDRSMTVNAGWTKAELEQAAKNAKFSMVQSAENEWKVGDRWFYLRDDRIVGIDWALRSKHAGY